MKQGSNLLQKSKTQGEPNYLMPAKKNGVTVLPFTHLPEASSITKHHLSSSIIILYSNTFSNNLYSDMLSYKLYNYETNNTSNSVN